MKDWRWESDHDRDLSERNGNPLRRGNPSLLQGLTPCLSPSLKAGGIMKANPTLLATLIIAGLCILEGPGIAQSALSQSDSVSAEVRLPPPRLSGPLSTEETLAQRRSVREFDARDLSLEEISQLLWAAQGITDPERGFRTAPSAGALYPLELYLVNRDGVFHFVPRDHTLASLSGEDLRGPLSEAALGQEAVRDAPLDIVICAVPERTRVRYGARAERYVLIESGHAAQNIHLQAVALGLGSVSIGAFDDEDVARLLGLPRAERPLYIIPVGHPQ
jgi:SagB-type dehydrogenase family enzyme